MKLLVISIFMIALAVVLLGVKVLFVKGGKFPSGHIHESKAMRARGITCVSADHERNNEKYHNP